MVQTPNVDLYKWGIDDDLVGSLQGLAGNAEKLDSLLSESSFYDEITYAKYRDVLSATDYFITYIPKLDKNGNLIKLKHGYQNDLMNSGNGESARSFAARKTASLVTNASRWDLGGSGLIRGVQIQDGVILQDVDGGTAYTLGINADNQLKAFPPSTTASVILAQGYTNTVSGFFPMIENGVAVDPAIYNNTAKEPRQAIAQLANGDIIFLTCHGRNTNNAGMSYLDMIRILLARGATFAYNLDGGGSTQTNVRGVTINDVVDDAGKTERPVADFLYIDSPATLKQKISSIPVDLGHMGKRINDIAADTVANKDANAATKTTADDAKAKADATDASLLSRFPEILGRVTNVDTIKKTGFYWSLGSATGAPDTAYSWGYIHMHASSDGDALQIAIPFHGTGGSIMTRRTIGTTGTYYAWRAM
jgi:hypothetical protein